MRWSRALGLGLRYGRLLISWLLVSNEHTNYTYHLTELNIRHLSRFISVALNVDHRRVKEYLDEVIKDSDLKEYIADRVAVSNRRFETDPEARYGRRIGWYAIVRLLKPAVVVETGTDKGLGSCVLASALLRNRQEGFPGTLHTIDVDTHAGWMIAHPYSQAVNLIIGDSHTALEDFSLPIDIFIHDSFHDYSYEAKEYCLINDKLAPGAVVISDNSHAGSALMDFAEASTLDFHFWGERPRQHFYAGGGIGLAISPSDSVQHPLSCDNRTDQTSPSP